MSMDEQKKDSLPRREEGTRSGKILVRPGNFNPPAGNTSQKNASRRFRDASHAATRNFQKTGDAAKNTAKAGGKSGGEQQSNRARENASGKPDFSSNGTFQSSGNRGRNNRRHDNRGQNKDRPMPPRAGASSEAGSVPVSGNPHLSGEQAGAMQRNGNNRSRSRKGRDGGRQPERNGASSQTAAVTISENLRRELDAEFASAPGSSSFGSREKESRSSQVADSHEFDVDIATAGYLLDDIPCGFPIPDGKSVEVVGIRFRHVGKIYFFAPGNERFRIGESAIVDTARGPELGNVVMLNRNVAEKDVIQPLRAVLRKATPEDEAHEAENEAKEKEALAICAEKIAKHQLDMKLVDAQYTFDNSKLLFYFTSEGRVDFRELVRDLASVFRTRIELRQIGIRDESRLIGGLGICGRPLCCATFLSEFGQVSVKMAKEQGLSINTSKISGCCGRLMCCLRYEHETYVREAAVTPPKDTRVQTPEGPGTVLESAVIAGTVKVRLDSAPEEAPHSFSRAEVTVIRPQCAHSPRPDCIGMENPEEPLPEVKKHEGEALPAQASLREEETQAETQNNVENS